jgi:hypothetical protein
MHGAAGPVRPLIGIRMIPQIRSTNVFDHLTSRWARPLRRAVQLSARCAECETNGAALQHGRLGRGDKQ